MDITELQRADNRVTRRHPWETARAQIILFLLRKYKPTSQAILDAGSGDAYVLNKLTGEELASRYLAVDTAYTPQVIEAIQKKNGDSNILYFNDYASIVAQASKADCCLLLDVLEHCENDRQVLSGLMSDTITTPDASFLITVPAFNSLFSQHDHLLLHYRRYSRRQLNSLCKSLGFEIIRSGYFFTSLLPARYLQILGEKIGLRKARRGLDGWKGNALFSRIFYAILWADFRISFLLSGIGIKIPGLSAYCICRKQPS